MAVRTRAREVFWAWLGGCVSIFCLAVLNRWSGELMHFPLLVGSFGSSAVLLFASPELPAAQPRNLLGGHILSAIAGVACRMLVFGHDPTLAAGLAVGTAIALMYATGTLHPPGGATALIAVVGGPSIHELGFGFVLMPCAVGACCMLLVALFTNNVCARRPYPQRWW